MSQIFNDYEISQARDINASHPENLCTKTIVALKDEGILDSLSPEDLAKLFKCVKTGLENPDSGPSFFFFFFFFFLQLRWGQL